AKEAGGASPSVTVIGEADSPDSPDSPGSLRHWLHASLDAQTERLTAEIRGLLPAQRASRDPGWLAGLAIVACIAALVATGFWWSDHTSLEAARAELT